MQDHPFATFVAPARARPQIWRVLAGCIIVLATMTLWLGAIFGVIAWRLGGAGAFDWLARLAAPTTPDAALLLLLTFGGMAGGTCLAARLLHGRGPATLFGPARHIMRDFAVGAGVVAGIYGASILLWSFDQAPEPNLPVTTWLWILPLALLGIAVQTGAEELLFRGYLMQQVAVRFGARWLTYLLPSAIFGLLHLDPATMGTNAWPIVASTALVGLVAADLTYVSGSLGAAWGLHFANNVAALSVVATKGTITGLALYVTPYRAENLSPATLLIDGAMIVAVWLILRRLVRR